MDMTQRCMENESVFADCDWRHIPEHRHGYLKNVKVTGFNSAKGLVEQACYILKNTVSLEFLTLDTIYCDIRCYLSISIRCDRMSEDILVQARRSVVTIRTYIEDEVPSTVKFTILDPSSRCHVRGFKV
ncbi:hypothetical protein QOZ80_8BG0642560 [Eleusine coracana subsp. coracana]|nr:hypothetical protein QOZ80_8BG0642560 [Eleusine coracana subsp. coracana]